MIAKYPILAYILDNLDTLLLTSENILILEFIS